MFKVDPKPEFTHEVPVMVPVDGGHREDKLKVRYRVLKAPEVKKFALGSAEGSRDFVIATVVRFEELVNERDEPIQYNDAIRDQLIDLPYVRQAIAQGYFDAIAKAAAGN